ncbi:MAG: hypothetical protein M1839_000137 [Geoglossum umbratile]|nr:MAG: hypothetical protein M1839_000137 [Geoglossum umbratile]
MSTSLKPPAAATSSLFTRTVVGVMRKMYPELLADRSFDNNGFLLEVPSRPEKKQNNSVLITLDLTRAVVDEAIRRKDSVIIAYPCAALITREISKPVDPIIFRGLKEITLANSQQESLLRLAQEGISVYSPHTAVDAVNGGLGDWMVDIVTKPFKERPGFSFESAVINGSAVSVQGFKDTGIGRVVQFSEAVSLAELLDAISHRLGMEYLQIALPQHLRNTPHVSIAISNIAMCAGSGGPIILSLPADVLFTGELSHHDALFAVEHGRIVIATFHSNSERGFLKEVMQPKLLGGLREAWAEAREREGMEVEKGEVEVGVSEVDRDPYVVVRVPGKGEEGLST